MYQSLKENDSFCSNPSHGNEFHEEFSSPLEKIDKIETIITISPEDSLFGLALKYNLRFFLPLKILFDHLKV